MQHTLCSVATCVFSILQASLQNWRYGVALLPKWFCKTVNTKLKIAMLRKPVRHKKYFRSTLHVSLLFFYSVNIALFHMMTQWTNKWTFFYNALDRVHFALTCMQLHVEVFALYRSRISTCFTPRHQSHRTRKQFTNINLLTKSKQCKQIF